MREAGQVEIADGNERLADYIEALECGLSAERALSARRTKQRDDARALVAELAGVVELFMETGLQPYLHQRAAAAIAKAEGSAS